MTEHSEDKVDCEVITSNEMLIMAYCFFFNEDNMDVYICIHSATNNF